MGEHFGCKTTTGLDAAVKPLNPTGKKIVSLLVNNVNNKQDFQVPAKYGPWSVIPALATPELKPSPHLLANTITISWLVRRQNALMYPLLL